MPPGIKRETKLTSLALGSYTNHCHVDASMVAVKLGCYSWLLYSSFEFPVHFNIYQRYDDEHEYVGIFSEMPSWNFNSNLHSSQGKNQIIS